MVGQVHWPVLLQEKFAYSVILPFRTLPIPSLLIADVFRCVYGKLFRGEYALVNYQATCDDILLRII